MGERISLLDIGACFSVRSAQCTALARSRLKPLPQGQHQPVGGTLAATCSPDAIRGSLLACWRQRTAAECRWRRRGLLQVRNAGAKRRGQANTSRCRRH